MTFVFGFSAKPVEFEISRIYLLLVFLSVQHFGSNPVRARITDRARRRLAAKVANFFCVLRSVDRPVNVCHLSILSAPHGTLAEHIRIVSRWRFECSDAGHRMSESKQGTRTPRGSRPIGRLEPSGYATGHSRRAIAMKTGLNRKTVASIVRSEESRLRSNSRTLNPISASDQP